VLPQPSHIFPRPGGPAKHVAQGVHSPEDLRTTLKCWQKMVSSSAFGALGARTSVAAVAALDEENGSSLPPALIMTWLMISRES